LQRSSDASYQVVAGEAIVIHLKTGVYYSLNEVGTAFWNFMDGTLSIAECAQRISEMLVDDRPPLAVIAADLSEIGEKLVNENLALIR
jgi:Coenzyme PQQ synthesis protein D (PqqD)